MWETVFYLLIAFVFAFVFLFVFWKNLKDDYIPSQIFSTSLIVLIFIGVGYFLSTIFKSYAFWIIFLSLIVGYIIGSIKCGIKFYEGFDSFIISSLFAFMATSPILYKYWQLNLILIYSAIVLSAVVFYVIKKNYKSFVWYKSGRRGFPGLFTLGIFFLIRSIVAIIKPESIFLLTEYDIFISGLISLISFLNIFVLGGK